ncbi:MAG: MerR family transcriptional regulator [Spirochaetaceae bacterium]|nr:MAG: MerR family transcriptional regulator [Spirochaetaceae bacterium]
MLSPTTEHSRKWQTLYRIGELAQQAGVTARTIRYYEELGILSAPVRPQARHRRYSEKDLLHLQRIQQLKEYGLTLGEIREIFDLSREDPSGEKSRLRLLTRYREKWREANKRKERIEAYIGDLEWHIDQLERVGNFQACPGEECRNCRYTAICKFYNNNRSEERP